MSNPAIRSEGGVRRFVVHAAHETRDQGRIVRASGFHEAALAYAEAWRPIPDANGAVRLSLTDLDSGEQQDATIDVARPGVADLQARRARLELRAAARNEPPPGAERFRIDPVEPFMIPIAKAPPRDYRQLGMNAAAVLAVLVVAFLVANQFTRDRLTRAPWEQQPGGVAEQPARRLTAAAALLRPQAQPPAAQPSAAAPAAASGSRPSGYFAPRQASGATTARNIPMDQLAPPPPDVSPADPLEIPPVEAVGSATPPEAATAPPATTSAPLVLRRSGEEDLLGSRSSSEEPPSDDLTDRLNQALEAPSSP